LIAAVSTVEPLLVVHVANPCRNWRAALYVGWDLRWIHPADSVSVTTIQFTPVAGQGLSK
jgi:hypothetical protein